MSTVVNNPTPTVVEADSSGWVVAVIILLAVIAGGAYWWVHYHGAAAQPANTTIQVNVPTSGSQTTPQ